MTSGLMQGKRGLVMGVANDHSIAWGIAKALAAEGRGARLHLSGRGARQARDAAGRKPRIDPGRAVRRGGSGLGRRRLRPDRRGMGRDRLSRPLHRLFRPQRAQGPIRRHDPRELRPDDGHIGLLVHRGRQARRGADALGRGDADADLRRLDPGHAQLQRHGRRQGGAGIERALSRRRLRPGQHPRQRHFGGARFARSPAPASRTRASCSISSAPTRPCGGR